MGKRLRDRDGSKILVVSGAGKSGTFNHEGKFFIRNMTYGKAEELLYRMLMLANNDRISRSRKFWKVI